MEQRLATIPQYTSLKIMKNRLDIMHMTADDYHNIMKVIIFVLDNLYTQQEGEGVTNADLSEVFYCFNKMYMVMRMKELLEQNCVKLQV